MPFPTVATLPPTLRKILPKHAQDIYKEAFSHAYDQYKNPDDRRGDEGREEVAHKVAWSAVKRVYQRGTDGNWHLK